MNKLTRQKSRRQLRNILVAFGYVALSLVVSGCSSLPPPSPTSENSTTHQPAARASVETPSPLSYGAITTTIKKNTTTQADLLALFGGPNIATLDSDGTEVWSYDRTASETTTTSQDNVSTQAKRLDVFFGLGIFSKGADVSQSSGSATVSHSIKSLTVIIKFNQNKTVKEYSARTSYF